MLKLISMQNKLQIMFIVLVLLLFILIISTGVEANRSTKQLNIIVSIYPLEDITKNIGGERVNVKTLIPAGASPHIFEPSPADIKEFARADLFIKIGAGLEFWAERFVRASKKDVKILDLSRRVQLLKGIDHEHHRPNPPEEGNDPHYWLDPVIVMDLVDTITVELIKLDPAWKDLYKENANLYKEKLLQLHEDIKRRISLFKKKEFIALHPAWNYFSRRYGLKPLYIIEASGREPMPQRIKEIVEMLKKKNIKAVFSEPQLNPRLAESIAKEIDLKVLFLDPLGSSHIRGRDTYINLIYYNTTMLEKAQ